GLARSRLAQRVQLAPEVLHQRVGLRAGLDAAVRLATAQIQPERRAPVVEHHGGPGPRAPEIVVGEGAGQRDAPYRHRAETTRRSTLRTPSGSPEHSAAAGCGAARRPRRTSTSGISW